LVIEADQRAAKRAQPQSARTILINDPDPICQAVRAIGIGLVINKPFCRWIKAAYSVLLAYPHMAVSVSIDREDVIRPQAVGIIRVVSVMLEAPSALVEPIKTAGAATHPQITRRIFVNAIDVSAFTERILVARLGNVMGNF